MANRYWVGGTANWDGTATGVTGVWAATSGAAATATAPTTADIAFFDASSGSGTVTVTGAINIGALATTGFTGTLTVGANNVTIAGLASQNGFSDTSGTHTINMGSGAWTINSLTTSNGVWNIINASLTLSKGTATLTLNYPPDAQDATVYFGGKAYGSVTMGPGFWICGTTPASFDYLLLSAGHMMIFLAAGSITFNNAQTWTGTRTAPIVLTHTSAAGANNVTMSCASGTMLLDWGILGRITTTGGATFTANNTVAYGAVATGWTVSAPTSGGGGGVIGG